ncbi:MULTISPECIES: hypothetical protein [unclassified Rickettsia]
MDNLCAIVKRHCPRGYRNRHCERPEALLHGWLKSLKTCHTVA